MGYEACLARVRVSVYRSLSCVCVCVSKLFGITKQSTLKIVTETIFLCMMSHLLHEYPHIFIWLQNYIKNGNVARNALKKLPLTARAAVRHAYREWDGIKNASVHSARPRTLRPCTRRFLLMTFLLQIRFRSSLFLN